jgi:PAS domain S-box-containing protein
MESNPSHDNLKVAAASGVSAQRAHDFMQAASEGVIFYTEAAILDCNRAFEQLLGRSHATLVGQHVLTLFAPQDHDMALRHIYLGRGLPINAKLPLPGGRSLDVEVIGRMGSYNGQPCCVATVRDTSTVVYVTDSLVRSQARYRALVEHADQTIMFLQDRRLAYANPAAARFFRLSAQQMRETESIYLMHPEDRPLALKRRKEMLAGDPDRSVMLRTLSPPSEHVQPNSVISWVRFYGSFVEWEGRAATLIFMTDLTAQHETQERMRLALTQEKELGDLKTRFVSMASHEFRTPLATIQTSSELLQHYSERLSNAQKTEAITDIQRSVQRMQGMMENFLAFGRMSSSSLQCKLAAVPLMPLVHSTVQEALMADGNQHVVNVYPHAPVEEATVLMLDSLLLRQILGNLLGNACKYSAFAGVVDLLVDSVMMADGSAQCPYLRLVVQDHGIGIPANDLPLLFHSFHRAANVDHIPGTGLGLAIVDRAVRAHGGTVTVESLEGQGARFEVLLPWVQVQLPTTLADGSAGSNMLVS